MTYYYQGYGFDEDYDGFVNVWTDGACSGNGYQNTKGGVGVFFGDNHPLNVSERLQNARQTNIVAEIEAVTIAANQARKAGIRMLRINTDSQYLIDCKKWLPKWKSNGWINSKGKKVVNMPDLQEMEEALSFFDDYDWEFVRSHNGTYENIMADKFAREGIHA